MCAVERVAYGLAGMGRVIPILGYWSPTREPIRSTSWPRGTR